jgi:hypothetical protein
MTTPTRSTPSRESRFLNAPALIRQRMTVPDAGCAEIKAHNRNGIIGGLTQLRKQCHRGTCRILITYLPVREPSSTGYQPQDFGRVKRVLVMATSIDRDYSNMSPEAKVQQVLGQKWYLVEDMDMKPKTDLIAEIAMGLGTPQDRGRFGSVMEPLVANAFNRCVLKPQPPRRRDFSRGSGTGSDVLWTELAGLYGELARELGNPFFAELASELATYGETQAA